MRDKQVDFNKAPEKSKKLSRKGLLIIVSAALAVCIIAGAAVGVILHLNRTVDYINDELDRYVYIDKDAYRGITVSISISEPQAVDLEEKIMQIIQPFREVNYTDSYNGTWLYEGELGACDRVGIYYKVYTDGGKTLCSNFSDFEKNKPLELFVGDGSFSVNGYAASGFDLSLVGVRIEDYKDLEGPLTVTVKLPYDYADSSLANKDVYADIVFSGYVDYTAPALTDEPITEKIKPDFSLDEYEGSTLAEKYKSYLMSELYAKYQTDRATLIEDTVWEYITDKMTVKKLPKGSVKARYREICEAVASLYELSGGGVTFDEYARAYFGLQSDTDIDEYVMSLAERSEAEKILFYYIIRSEDWTPSEEEFRALYNKEVDEYVSATAILDGVVRENYKSDSEYQSALSEFKKGAIKENNDYFLDCVYSEYGMKKIIENVIITEK